MRERVYQSSWSPPPPLLPVPLHEMHFTRPDAPHDPHATGAAPPQQHVHRGAWLLHVVQGCVRFVAPHAAQHVCPGAAHGPRFPCPLQAAHCSCPRPLHRTHLAILCRRLPQLGAMAPSTAAMAASTKTVRALMT
jgi:hypothetical protein